MTMRTSIASRRRTVSVVLAALTAVTLTACSQSAQAGTCERMDGVGAAIDNLNNVTVSGNGMVALKDGLTQMQNELTQLRSEVSQAMQQQVDAVKTSVQQLQTSVEDARTNPTSASLAAVRNNLQGTHATIANLRGAVAAGC
jgi:peptidoglycan hydrolase CwlO-like protein